MPQIINWAYSRTENGQRLVFKSGRNAIKMPGLRLMSKCPDQEKGHGETVGIVAKSRHKGMLIAPIA